MRQIEKAYFGWIITETFYKEEMAHTSSSYFVPLSRSVCFVFDPFHMVKPSERD